MTELEKELAWLLADMVSQNLHEEDGVFDTGCIRIHKEAMIKLCDLGIMEECFKEKDYRKSWTRWFYAKFVPYSEWASKVSA